jgi:hypothetical protein
LINSIRLSSANELRPCAQNLYRLALKLS